MTQKAESITILVADDDELEVRGALPGPLLHRGVKAVPVALEALEKGMQDVIGKLLESITRAMPTHGTFVLEDVEFSLGVAANGEVGLLGTAKGGVEGTAHFSLKFRRRS
jgi:hypothetical protein